MTTEPAAVPQRRDALTTPPQLSRLLAMAAATARGRTGAAGTLPNRALVQRGITLGADQASAYDKVCGFPVTTTAPITFGHILAFPLQVALMVEKDFPLALPGLIHVSNEMTQHEPLRIGDTVDATVWAADLRPHRRGTVVDLHGRLEQDGHLIWSGRSTYLKRGDSQASATDATEASSQGPAAAGPPAQRWRVPGDIGRRYAQVSGDVNPIHLHAVTAKLAGMPGAIAHGMWTHARSLAALGPRVPERATVTAEFKRSVRLPSSVDVYFTTQEGHQEVVLTAKGRPETVLLTSTVRS